MNRLMQRFSKGPILGAEGYLFELERRGWVSIGPFVPEVVLDNPNAVKQLHREFVRSGSDVIEAFTYYAHREKLKLINKENILKQLNYSALKIANEVRNEFYELYPDIYNTESIENELLIAGNICNSTIFFGRNNTPDYINIKNTVKSMFDEQCEWSADNNVDFIIGETFDCLEESLIALESIKGVNLGSVINLAIHSLGTTLDGYTPEEALEILIDNGADCVGLNCARGPDTMLPLLKRIKERLNKNGKGDTPIAALPVCYRTNDKNPTFQSLSCSDGDERKLLCDLDRHVCDRFEIEQFTKDALDIGVKYLGVCCGGAPHHVRAMAEAMGRIPLSSKYNPNIKLHFALGSNDKNKIDNYL